jgi:integrase
VQLIPEPYATMVYVAIYSGLCASELIGLRWKNVKTEYEQNEKGEMIERNAIVVEEKYCRGEWGPPKSAASNAAVEVPAHVIERIHRLKSITLSIKAGTAVRHYPAVKSSNPEDLVFQSPITGAPMRDNSILSRFIKPGARKLGIGFVNWQCLRRSYATWLKEAGADVKDAQAQMRHSRVTTTLEIYQQHVPESQHRVVSKLFVPNLVPNLSQNLAPKLVD